jgi:hypothetical protein
MLHGVSLLVKASHSSDYEGDSLLAYDTLHSDRFVPMFRET